MSWMGDVGQGPLAMEAFYQKPVYQGVFELDYTLELLYKHAFGTCA